MSYGVTVSKEALVDVQVAVVKELLYTSFPPRYGLVSSAAAWPQKQQQPRENTPALKDTTNIKALSFFVTRSPHD